MNIEEARKVLWLKNNPRPLGELLGQGFLTRGRLEWAAQKALNPDLKEAAKVLLETDKPAETKIEKQNSPTVPVADPVTIGMTLNKARATVWPFMPYKGQAMGPLVESKQLSLKDLGYAAEFAWDQRVRQAAVALSLVRLEQLVKEPTRSAGFIEVISGGRSFSEQKQSRLTFLDGAVFGLVVTIMILTIIYLVKVFVTPHPQGTILAAPSSFPFGILGIVGAIVIAVLAGLLIGSFPDRISKRLNKQIEEYRRGQEGEDRVVELIVQALDGNWHLVRNVSIPGRNKGDLDLVLVGPPGIWVLEVKNWRGNYRNSGENWEYSRGKKWKNAKENPSRQAQKDAYRLKNFLKADGLNIFVNVAVVWANEEIPLVVENPSVAVWTYSRLADELGNIWQQEKLSELEREKITGKLSRLCEAEKNRQARLAGQREAG